MTRPVTTHHKQSLGCCWCSALALALTLASALAHPAGAQNLREIDREIARSGDQHLNPIGFYVGGMAGLTFVEDVSLIAIDGGTPAQDTDFDFEESLAGYGFFGFDFGPVRTELEVGGRLFEINRVREDGVTVPGADGDVGELSLMANLIFDIPVTDRFEFYAGGGAGGAFLFSDIDESGLDSVTDFVFAYQAVAGAQFEVAPRLYLNLGYRVHSFDDPNFDGVEYDAPLIQSVDFGIRYVF
ncbi:MAG: outer membrane beta-barrel protein [Planctomycetota bacterium]